MGGRFLVDERGQLTSEGTEGQRALATCSGKYTLASTAPDLLLFFRLPAKGGEGPEERVVLAGDVAGFPLADLLAFLGHMGWTGAVRLHAGSGERALFLKEGELRGASSEEPADRLGEVITRLGYLSREKVDQVVANNPPSKVGRALVEQGLMAAHDLYKCLTHQVSEIFHAMVLTREGAFELVRQSFEEKASSNVRLPVQSLLMDSVRRVDEMAHFRKRIAHGGVFVAPKKPADGDLEPEEAEVLAAVNGERTVLELGQIAKVSEFDATKAIYRLLEGGYVTVSERPGAPAVAEPVAVVAQAPSGARKIDETRVVITFNGIFREIFAELRRRGRDAEFLTAANAALTGEGLSQGALLADLEFGPDGALPEGLVLMRFEQERDTLGPDPVAGLKRALSDVMFFLLFQTGELLESQEDEALGLRVKGLLATLEPA